MKGQSMITALKLCLHSFSHFLQRSLYFIRLRWSRKKAHSNLYFLLNLGIVISCAFRINDYSRGVFLNNIWLRHGFLHMNNGYGHIYHLVGSKVFFWDLSGRQTADLSHRVLPSPQVLRSRPHCDVCGWTEVSLYPETVIAHSSCHTAFRNFSFFARS